MCEDPPELCLGKGASSISLAGGGNVWHRLLVGRVVCGEGVQTPLWMEVGVAVQP